MWARSGSDIDLSMELNEVARALLRLDPVPTEVELNSRGVTLGGLGIELTRLPHLAALLATDPSATVVFTCAGSAAAIRLGVGRAVA